MSNPIFSSEVVSQTRDEVGEGPFWDGDTGALIWVDIVGRALRRLVLEGEAGKAQGGTQAGKAGAVQTWRTQDYPTAIALRQNGQGAIVALASGVGLVDFPQENAQENAQENHTLRITPLCAPESVKENRLNEAKCDPAGRFWVGSMQNNLNPDGSSREMTEHTGAVFCVDPHANSSASPNRRDQCHTPREFGITNTMAWSPENKVFYIGDSLRNVIFAYDYDLDDARISNQRVLCEGHSAGAPDGSAIDDTGCLWNARFGGSQIIRITPQGKIDQIVELPVSQPTSATFGGRERDRLLITSARFGLNDGASDLDGAVLSLNVGQKGPADVCFAG